MRKDVIHKAMDQLDDELILEALPGEKATRPESPKISLSNWEKYMAVAACLLMLISVAPVAMRISKGAKPEMAYSTAAGNGAEVQREAAADMEEVAEAAEEPAAVPEDMAQLANPITWYDYLDEINQAIGCEIHEVKLTEKEDVSFQTIAGDPIIAQYEFLLNNKLYTIRAGETEADITGVYLTKGTLSEMIKAKDGMPYEAEGYSAAIWFDGNMQYCVYSPDASAEELEQVLQAMR